MYYVIHIQTRKIYGENLSLFEALDLIDACPWPEADYLAPIPMGMTPPERCIIT